MRHGWLTPSSVLLCLAVYLRVQLFRSRRCPRDETPTLESSCTVPPQKSVELSVRAGCPEFTSSHRTLNRSEWNKRMRLVSCHSTGFNFFCQDTPFRRFVETLKTPENGKRYHIIRIRDRECSMTEGPPNVKVADTTVFSRPVVHSGVVLSIKGHTMRMCVEGALPSPPQRVTRIKLFKTTRFCILFKPCRDFTGEKRWT